MTVAPGVRLGPYEIVARLGAGGMGEVYRALDTRLERPVAVKVLATEIAGDTTGRQRLEREARAISKLNHPHICTLYDVGTQGECDFLVMELLEGVTLQARLAQGPLPVAEAIDRAIEIADALAAAHERGILHRDLKPGNIMLTPGGAKLLDFGLAKVIHEPPAGAPAAALRTAPTEAGMVLGTIGYMSPEQARGEPVGPQSDQFAFGAILYEMITGVRAFGRPSAAETLGSILRDDPPSVARFAPHAPQPLVWTIQRCLSKDRQHRYNSTLDLLHDLRAIRGRLHEAPAAPREAPAYRLPLPPTPLVGRESEVSEVQALLDASHVRLVTLTGPGGAGKTRIALEVAAKLASDGAIVAFVALGALPGPALIVPALVTALGVTEIGSRAPLDAVAGELAAARVTLLVLDNFEQLLPEAAAVVSRLSAACPRLTILVTSRIVLHVYGEHELGVPPLALPDPRTARPEVLARSAAVSLFAQRAAAVKPGFSITAENGPIVAEICRRVDALPLAIELAAARMKALSPAAILQRLESRLELLTTGAQDLPERQQTLRATIEWSHELLSPPEQKLFRRLSVFVGGAAIDAAEAVGDTRGDLGIDVLEGLSSLVDKSLLTQFEAADGEVRFRMLETIREYAADRLAASGESAEVRRAHAAYAIVLAEEGAEGQKPSENALRLFDVEQDNLRAALEYLIGTADGGWALRLGLALFPYWEVRDEGGEGADWLRAILAIEPRARTRERALASMYLSALLTPLGEYDRAWEAAEQSIAIHRELGDRAGEASAINASGVIARRRGDYQTARARFTEAVERWREAGGGAGLGGTLTNLATVLSELGDYEGALVHLELQQSEREANPISQGLVLSKKADVLRDMKDLERARACSEEALALFRSAGFLHGVGRALADLARIASEQRDLHSARALSVEALDVYRRLDHRRGLVQVLEALAASAAAHSRPQRVLVLAGAAAALRETSRYVASAAERARLDPFVEQARASLGPTAGPAAWLEGWTMSPDEMIAFAARDEPQTNADPADPNRG